MYACNRKGQTATVASNLNTSTGQHINTFTAVASHLATLHLQPKTSPVDDCGKCKSHTRTHARTHARTHTHTNTHTHEHLVYIAKEFQQTSRALLESILVRWQIFTASNICTHPRCQGFESGKTPTHEHANTPTPTHQCIHC